MSRSKSQKLVMRLNYRFVRLGKLILNGDNADILFAKVKIVFLAYITPSRIFLLSPSIRCNTPSKARS